MTPSGLSSLAFPISQPLYNGRVGPYEHGGAFYVVACEAASRFANTNLVVYKSVDAGATQPWTRIASLSNTIPNGAASVYWPGSGTVIYIGFMDDSGGNHGAFHDTTFDMATETFGAVDDLGISTPNYSGTLFLLHLTSGDLVFAWGEFSGGIRNVKFALKTGGIWSAATTVSGLTANSFMFGDMYEDANGAARLLWYNTDVSFVPLALTDATLSGLTVTNATLPNDPSKFVNLGSPSLYDVATDTVAYPVCSKQNLAENEVLYIRGVDVSTSPVWSSVSVFEESATTDDFGFFPQIVPVTGGFAYFWTDFDTGLANILTSTAATLAGPWSAPTIYYDSSTDPTVPPAVTNELYPLYAIGLSNGTPGLIIGAVQPVEAHNFCGVLYYLPPVAPTEQTLQLVVQIVGGTAVPSDSTATAVGPVTISGAGGVGPSNVDVGTYALSATPISNYTQSDFVCVGGSQSGNNETVNPGDMDVCTVIFTLIALAVGCPVISNGTVGIPFTAAIVVTGGVPPYSFAIISGTLGPGLTLNTVTGVITGTPTASGTFTYTVQVTDAQDTVVTTTCQITIANHCPIVLPSADTCPTSLPSTDTCPSVLPQDTCTCPD